MTVIVPTEPTGAAVPSGDEPPPALFNRPPRILRTLPTDEITIPGPPQAPSMRTGMRLIGIIIPLVSSLVYIAIAAARGSTGSGGALISALPIVVIGLLTGGAGFYTYRQQKREHEAALVAYRESYQQALERVRRQLQQLERQQRACYEENDPDLKVLLQLAQGEARKSGEPVPASRLWERRHGDADFLALRVGRGDRPTSLTIKPPSVTAYSKDVEDSLMLADQFRVVRDVPVSLNLRHLGSIGIAGPSGRSLNLLQALIWQIVVHHAPSDVRIAALWDSGFDDSWDWVHRLPHTRPLDGDATYRLLARYDRDPEEVQRVVAALTKELKRRRDEERPGRRAHVIVIISDYFRYRERYPLFASLITARNLDMSTICLVPEVRDVPSECGGYIDLNHSGSIEHTRLGVAGVGGGYTIVKADLASTDQSRELALMLAPVELADTDGSREMPRNVSLLSLLEINDAASYDPTLLWSQRPANSWHAVPVGAQSADQALEINLNEGIHGVHGMIAGATGAGKSELLLSFLMALAIRHHPDRLNFLLIDFKGGATFRDLERLPHTAGMVTDLSGFLAERALIAINSELDRRKRLLSSRNVANIKGYRQKGFDQGEGTLPNLFIAIDEFDEMIRDYPQFQDELIRVGKQGRSLGVHLLFATQQPSLIKEGLLNNLSYWMSLRVNSKDDSRAMLGVPDASQLGTDTPGRGFLRDKNSGVRIFQSALITAAYRPVTGRSTLEASVTGFVRVNTSEKRALHMFRTELDELVQQLTRILPEASRNQVIAQTATMITQQFHEIFEQTAESTVLAEQISITRQTLQQFVVALHQLPTDQPRVSEAELIEQQITQTAQRLLTALLGDRPQETEISLIGRQMIAVQGERYAAQRFRIWEEPLPKMLPLIELLKRQERERQGKPSTPLDVAYGLLDQPETARHMLLTTDLAGAGGNLLAIGSQGSGKTALVQTMVLSLAATHSPNELWFYVLDSAGSGLGMKEKLPHLAHAIGAREHLLVERLFVELQGQIEDRRSLFQQHGLSSINQYRERILRLPNAERTPTPPAIVVVIDNLAELISQNEIVLETLKTMLRECRAYGIYVLATVYQTREVASIRDNFETRIILRVNSDDESSSLGVKTYASRLIKPDQPGRAFLPGTPRPIEAQIALPALETHALTAGQGATASAEDEDVAYSDLAQQVERSCTLVRTRWQRDLASPNARPPQPLQLLPTHVPLAELSRLMPTTPHTLLPLGLEGASLQPLIWPLEQTAHLLITGSIRGGKRTLMQTLVAAAAQRFSPQHLDIILVDYSVRALRALNDLPHMRQFPDLALASREVRHVSLVSDKDELQAVIQKLSGEIKERDLLLRTGAPLPKRTLLVIYNWDLVSQDTPTTAPLEAYIRRGADLGLHCLISYSDYSVTSRSLITAVRTNTLEVVSGRPHDSAPYVTNLRNRFKSVLSNEMPPGRGFVIETGRAPRLAQFVYANASDIQTIITDQQAQHPPRSSVSAEGVSSPSPSS